MKKNCTEEDKNQRRSKQIQKTKREEEDKVRQRRKCFTRK